ncbi:MAG: GNAT family N-acetyltransferase [Bacteroidales bacterium]|nr:GNAT family N-acetyltransferase [Bacteroidales bacterium]
MEYIITQNKEAYRFETTLENGQVAYLDYNEINDALNYAHTYVPKTFEGRGIAASIVKFALEYARNSHLHIIPSCPYVATYIERHPEYRDLVKQGPSFQGEW